MDNDEVLKHHKFCNTCNSCPEGELVKSADGEFIVLKDDFGESVRFTVDQFEDVLRNGHVLLPR
ncbi:hypothetical protein M1432_03395 [Patescibacteria group bacterium]|nr:hypothetical protein [Patescibacteria group bacterium]